MSSKKESLRRKPSKKQPTQTKVYVKNHKQKRSAYILSGMLISMMLLRLVTGLIRPSPSSSASQANHAATATVVATPNTQDIAQSALQKYFQLLHDHRYTEAVTYYGGSYDELASLNPDDASNHADLLKDACTQNGYQCLTVKSVTGAEAVDSDTYTFRVEFTQDDGSLLVRPSDQAGVDSFVFPFTVKQVEGHYLVQELPIQ